MSTGKGGPHVILLLTWRRHHSIKVNKGEAKPEDFDNYGLPTIKNTIVTTAIIRAGRVSLDEKRSVVINLDSNGEYSLQ